MADLEELIKTEMKRQGTSRSELARKIGYKRITKGLRRLDTFVTTLVGPDDFPEQLKTTLGISDETFIAAARETYVNHVKRVRELFKPYVYVISDPPARGWSGQFRYVKVPKEMTEKSEEEQLAAVRKIFDERRKELNGNMIGCIYYRSYDESFELDAEGKVLKHNTSPLEPIFASFKLGGKLIQIHPDPVSRSKQLIPVNIYPTCPL